jgi:hypothetical protein
MHGHPARPLLRWVTTLINRRSLAGSITRFIKVKAHRAEPRDARRSNRQCPNSGHVVTIKKKSL